MPATTGKWSGVHQGLKDFRYRLRFDRDRGVVHL